MPASLPADQKALNILGLARRAGKTACGADAVREAILSGRACAVVLARDAARNTAEKVHSLAVARGVPEFVVGSKTEIGRRFGRESLAVLCLLDKSFLAALTRSTQTAG
jgi:ribosomal protein L7Ae-like RNA K-turn-binding protein